MKRSTSIWLGYGFALICVLLSVTLVMQRYSYPGDEALKYEIKKGTRIVIDLTNGQIHEKLRPLKSEIIHIKALQHTVSVPHKEHDESHAEESDDTPKHEKKDEFLAPSDHKLDHGDHDDHAQPTEHAAIEEEHIEKTSDESVVESPAETEPAAPLKAMDFDANKGDKEFTPPIPDYRRNGKPVIAVIIKGLGMSAHPTELAENMPAFVTLGFSPYSPYLNEWVKSATQKKHDILLNIPMESSDFGVGDPGPYSLLINLPLEDNLRRLNLVLSRTVRYTGVYTVEDERFTSVPGSVNPIVKELKKRKVELIYGGGYDKYSFVQVAEKNQYPVLTADVHINSAIDKNVAIEKMNGALASAQKKGFAVIMVAPYPVTIDLASEWIKALPIDAVTPVPVSYLLAKKREAWEEAEASLAE